MQHRDVVLLLPEDAPVVAPADLDEVVEEAHEGHHEDGGPHDQRLVGERQAVAHVGDDPADEGGDDDGDAAHRRRALLGHVVLGPAVLLAEDRLAEARAVRKSVDQERVTTQREQRRPRRRRSSTGDHGRATGLPSRAASSGARPRGRRTAAPGRRSSASSRGPCRRRPRRRRGRPRPTADGDRRRPVRLDDDARPVLDPAQHGADDGGRVLRTRVVRCHDDATSAQARPRPRPCAAASGGRGRHRHRTRRSTRPAVDRPRRRASDLLQPVGRVGVVDDRDDPSPVARAGSTRSKRPGTAPAVGQPGGDRRRASMPSTAAVVAAASVLATLNAPPRPTDEARAAPRQLVVVGASRRGRRRRPASTAPSRSAPRRAAGGRGRRRRC